jgi:hypothetical protein
MSPLHLLTTGPDGEPERLPIHGFTMVSDAIARSAPTHACFAAFVALCRCAGRGYEVTATNRDILAASAEGEGQPVSIATLVRTLRWLESAGWIVRKADPRVYSGRRILFRWRRPQSLAELAHRGPNQFKAPDQHGGGGLISVRGGPDQRDQPLIRRKTERKSEPGRSAVVGEAPPPAPARSEPDPGAAPMTPEELAAWRQSLGLPPPPPPENPTQAAPKPGNVCVGPPPSSASPRDPEAELRRLRAWAAKQPPRPAPPCPAPTTEEPANAGPDPPPE